MLVGAGKTLRRVLRFLRERCIDVCTKAGVRAHKNGCPMGIVKEQRTDKVLSIARIFGKPLLQPLKRRD